LLSPGAAKLRIETQQSYADNWTKDAEP